jgi:CO/xanthine dehydrogenase FAD-binding subunit
VIKAIGENPDPSILPAKFQQKARKAPSAHLLGKNLFAGGDFIAGPSTVVQAIASGREAARLIELSFKDRKPSAEQSDRNQGFTSPCFEVAPRIQVPVLPVSERIKSIDIEDAPGLGPSEIKTEASRCFNCGCLAVSPSDIAISLVALDANIVTTKRTLDAQSFFSASATGSTVLDQDELVTEIQIPKPRDGVRQSYLKFTLRTPVDFGIVSVASVVAVEKGICTDARIALGAVAPSPVRAKKAEEVIKGRPIDPDVAAEAAERAVAGALPLSMNAYKIEITKTLVKRAILSS